MGDKLEFDNIERGDRIILKGSRKTPVDVISKRKEDIIEYQTSRGTRGAVVKNQFTNKAYDITNNSTKIVRDIRRY